MADESYTISIAEDGNGTNRLIVSLNAVGSAGDRAAAGADKAAGGVRRAGDASRKASDDTSLLTRALGNTEKGYGLLTSALGTFLGALTLTKLTNYADVYTNIRNKLLLVTPTQLSTNAAMEKSFQIAQDTRQSWESTAAVYGKVSDVLTQLKKPATEAADITKTITQALALSGSSAEGAKAALVQFEQGLNNGALRGEEFNSVMEQANGLAKALADGLNVPIGNLRAMANAGQLTSEKIIEALEKVGPKIDKAFLQNAPTISQAWQVVENSVIKYIGTVNNANSFSGIFSNTLISLSKNMNVVAPIVMSIVAALGLMAAVQFVTALYSLAVGFVTLAAAAGSAAVAIGTAFIIPIAAVALAIGAAIIVAKIFGISLSDISSKTMQLLQSVPGLGGAVNNLTTSFDASKNAANGVTGAFNANAQATQSMGNSATTFNAQGQELRTVLDNTSIAADKANVSFGNLTGSVNASAGAAKNAKKSYNELEAYLESIASKTDVLAKVEKKVKKEKKDSKKATDELKDSYDIFNPSTEKVANSNNNLGNSLGYVVSQANAATDAINQYAISAANASTVINELSTSRIGDLFGADWKDSRGLGTDAGTLSYDTGYNFKFGGSDITGGYVGYHDQQQTGKIWSADAVRLIQKALDNIQMMDPSIPQNVLAQWIKQLPGGNGTGQGALSAARLMDLFYAYEKKKKSSTGTTSGSGSSSYAQGRSVPLGFAGGGSFLVDGAPGTDSNLVSFFATHGEKVSISTPRDVRKGSNDNPNNDNYVSRQDRRPVIINVTTPDASSFRRSARQTAMDAKRILDKVR